MNFEPPPLPPKKPLTLPVVLAFVPSVLGLLLATVPVPKETMGTFCVVALVISIACCAISSAMLIKRNTGGAVAFGILLGLLNLAISAGLGCAAMLSNINVH